MGKQLIRFIKSGWFYFAVIGVFLLCLFSELMYVEEGNKYTLLYLLLNDKVALLDPLYQCSAVSIVQNAISGGYVTLAVPVIVALPVVVIMQSEKVSGFKRLSIFRQNKRKYYVSRWFSGMVTGGIILVAGVFLFQVLIHILIMKHENVQDWTLEMENVIAYLEIFCYGFFSVIPAIIVCSYTENIYLCICLPFLIVYFWDLIIQKLLSLSMNSDKVELLSIMYSKGYVMMTQSFESTLFGITRAGISLVIVWLVWRMYLSKKLDCGV